MLAKDNRQGENGNVVKVIHITRGFGDYVIELLNAMSGLAETHIVLARQDEWLAEHLNGKVRVFKSDAPRVGNILNLASLLSVIRYIHKEKPDVIHLQSGVVWEAMLTKAFRHIPCVITVHDITRHPVRKSLLAPPQRLLDFAARHADGIIVHGDALLRTARDRYPSRRIIRSLDHGVISRYGTGLAADEPRNNGILLFGGVNTWKGIEYLIEAEPIIRESVPEAKIIVAGFTQDPDYYRGLVREGQAVEMRLARQSDDDVRALFEWADILVLPYIEASQSGVLQLGFSFGIPSVVTDVGGLPDVICDERNGFVVPPRDPAALARAIVRLLLDVDLRRQIIGAVASERETRFNWDSIARQTLGVYEEVLEESRSR